MANPTKFAFNALTGGFDIISNTDATGLTFNAPIISNTVPGSPATGQMWMTDTLNVKVPGGTLQVGQEMYLNVINKTGSIIANGKFVYTSGVDTGFPKAVLAQANAFISHSTIAMTTNAIPIDGVSNVTTSGIVHDLNTTVDSEGNALAAGDMIYLSATVAGGFTKIEPYAPNYSMQLGTVLVVDASIGQILVDIQHNNARDLALVTKDPTGFDNPENVIVTYDPVARTITLTGTFNVYWRGAWVKEVVTGHVSAPHNAANNNYYYYFNGTSVVWDTNPWTFDMVMIAYVQYGAVDKFATRECHGLMDYRAHQEFHKTIGTYRTSGGTLSNYTLASTTAANKRPDISACTIFDEDLQTINAASSSKLYTKAFLTGTTAAPVMNFTVETAEIVPMNSGIVVPAYNLLTGGNWTQAAMTNNTYSAVWVFEMPMTASATSQKYRHVWMQGQTLSNTLATIQALTPADLNLGNLTTLSNEFVFITKLIIQYVGGPTNNWNIVSVTDLTGNRFVQSSAGANIYLSSVAHDTTLTGDGSLATPLSTTPANSTTGTYNGRVLPASAAVSVANLQSSTLTFSADGAMMFTIALSNGYNILCMACFTSASITVLSDIGAQFLLTDAGTGIYINKSANSYNVLVKNRTGGAVSIAIQAINSNITTATAWA